MHAACPSPAAAFFHVLSKDFVRLCRSNRYTCTNAASSFVHFFHVTTAEKEGRPNQYLAQTFRDRRRRVVAVGNATTYLSSYRRRTFLTSVSGLVRSTEYLIVPLYGTLGEFEASHTVTNLRAAGTAIRGHMDRDKLGIT